MNASVSALFYIPYCMNFPASNKLHKRYHLLFIYLFIFSQPILMLINRIE